MKACLKAIVFRVPDYRWLANLLTLLNPIEWQEMVKPSREAPIGGSGTQRRYGPTTFNRSTGSLVLVCAGRGTKGQLF